MQIHYDLAPLFGIGLGHWETETLCDKVFHTFGLTIGSLTYLFDRPVLNGRLMRWLVLLIEFDIHYVT